MSLVAGVVAPVVPGPDDPPIAFGREQAAYAKQKERLLRDHPGHIALFRGDELVGVFPSADAAILEAYQRFGPEQVMLQEIRDSDTPDFVNLVDTRHPSFKRIG